MSASRALFGVAVLLLGGAVVSLFFPSHPTAEPPLVVDPLVADLGTVTSQTHTMRFTVSNPADKSRRVIGLAEG